MAVFSVKREKIGMKKTLTLLAAAAVLSIMAAPMASADDQWSYRNVNANSTSTSGAAGGTVAGAGTLGNGIAGAESFNGVIAGNNSFAGAQLQGNTALTETGSVSQFESLSTGGSFSLGNGGGVALGGGLGGANGFSSAWASRSNGWED